MHLKGQWLKDVGFETGFTFTVKILNGCLVLIPDSEDIRAMKQQNQQQQAQLSEIKNSMRELMAEYVRG
ncbi:SymE family type I addiction module toxin [Providencia stuartii]|uniref:SymE family type I addiction module toxin n=1 Tax=Providencia stuartii TaxID=588 RepID=UPI003873291C